MYKLFHIYANYNSEYYVITRIDKSKSTKRRKTTRNR